tara:strand:+ start:255 stop:632 length:378 start_codon:yes stop_codon:yes gene_type:complete
MQINKTTLKSLRTYLEKVLVDNPIEGINLELGNCSFDSSQADFKLKVTISGGETREQLHLKDVAQIHNINLEFKHPTWVLEGYRSKARSKPFLASKRGQSKTDARYILSLEDITRLGFINSKEGA